jgi:hypothetical protein
MFRLLRRSLVVIALMFWQGGFTFYAAVVVPIGQDVLRSHLQQGLITRRVTNYLNLAGVAALVPLAWDAAASREGSGRRRWLRGAGWAGMALTLALLAFLHGRLDELLDPVTSQVLDRKAFRPGHRLYLWVSTVQWGLGLVYLVLTVQAWRDEDRSGQAPTAHRP